MLIYLKLLITENFMNIIDNSGKDRTDVGMMCDTYKVNTCILLTFAVPIDVMVHGQPIEELSLMKNGVLKSELSKSELNKLLPNILCE